MTTSFADILFLTCVAWLFAHELDAIRQHEWRILPLTSWMRDDIAYAVFVLTHIPLFIIIVIALPYIIFQLSVDIFLILHAGLHILFRHNSAYTFNNTLSRLLIFGVVPLVILHLLVIVM